MSTIATQSWHSEFSDLIVNSVLPNECYTGFSQQGTESEVTPSRNVARYSAARVLAEACGEADLSNEQEEPIASDSDFEP